jgi:hypothetical protein
MTPIWLTTLAERVRAAFGALPSGLEPFELDDGTERIGGLVLPFHRCYPLRALADGRKPTITSRHYLNNPERKNHNGVDFFYRYDAAKDPPMRAGDGGRTSRWWIPDRTWAIAPADGLVTIAGNSRTGHRVWIQHAGGLLTGGFHMTEIGVKAGDAVKMGDPIGIVGDNPADHDARHLHWECYLGAIGKYPRGTVDPERWLRGAKVLADAGDVLR